VNVQRYNLWIQTTIQEMAKAEKLQQSPKVNAAQKTQKTTKKYGK